MAVRDVRESDQRNLDQSQLDRRRFLRNAAIAAWTSPVILSVVAGRAAADHANSCEVGGVRTPCSPSSPTACSGNAPCTRCCPTGTVRANTCAKPVGAACTHDQECCNACPPISGQDVCAG